MDINQLCDRYNLASRKSLYRRLEGIGLELNKENGKVSATEEQIVLLDQLNEHISKGYPASAFVPLSASEIVSDLRHSETQSPRDDSTSRLLGHSETQLSLAPEIINLIAQALPVSDPLLPQKRLELVVVNEWELTTSQVKNIIGVKPTIKKGKDCYVRGSFLFYKIGKIGNESAWIVKKNDRITIKER